jgi:hypothetical protein
MEVTGPKAFQNDGPSVQGECSAKHVLLIINAHPDGSAEGEANPLVAAATAAVGNQPSPLGPIGDSLSGASLREAPWNRPSTYRSDPQDLRPSMAEAHAVQIGSASASPEASRPSARRSPRNDAALDLDLSWLDERQLELDSILSEIVRDVTHARLRPATAVASA